MSVIPSRRSGPRYDPVRRRAATLKRYGLTPPDYARLLLAQDGKCGICLRVPSGRMFDVDHDHKTREIRGLLCFLCNKGLGYFRSGADLMRAADYIYGPARLDNTRDYTGYFVPKRKRRR